jgi:hypothetical protein
MPSLDGGDDFVRVCRPGEWLRVGVGLSDEPVDGRLEIDDGAEDTAFQSTSAELGEKSLDSVEPGARGWCEVENETRVAIEPGANVGVFVSCIVVENDVDDLAERNLSLDGIQKSNEFLMTMTLHVAADDRAVEDVEGGEQCRGAVPTRRALLSEFPCLFFPTEYPVLNKPVALYVRPYVKAPRGSTEGAKYLHLALSLRAALRDSPQYPAKDLLELDGLIWEFQRVKAEKA